MIKKSGQTQIYGITTGYFSSKRYLLYGSPRHRIPLILKYLTPALARLYWLAKYQEWKHLYLSQIITFKSRLLKNYTPNLCLHRIGNRLRSHFILRILRASVSPYPMVSQLVNETSVSQTPAFRASQIAHFPTSAMRAPFFIRACSAVGYKSIATLTLKIGLSL